MSKYRQINFRLSEEQGDQLDLIAQMESKTAPEYVKGLVLAKLLPESVGPPPRSMFVSLGAKHMGQRPHAVGCPCFTCQPPRPR